MDEEGAGEHDSDARPVWWRRVLSTGREDFEDQAAFLRRRVQLYLRVVLGFMIAFLAVGALKLLFFWSLGFDHPMSKPSVVLWSNLLIGGLTITVALALVAVRRVQTSSLQPLELGVTLLLCLGAIEAMPLLPQGAPALMLAFPVLLYLVLRAALVPSSPTVTLGVGLATSVALSGAFYWRVAQGPTPDVFHRYVWTAPLIFGAFFSVATAIVSRVIYGLQERVREAMQLGNYHLREKLGEGGMGEVYLADHALLKRPTAVKLLPPEKVGERAIARFEREVRQLARLTHPNTVSIFDFGRTPGGIFYYAMEYLDGLDLEELVELEGPQPPGRVAHILSQVSRALAEAHDVGLIHRDVKPANVMLCHRGGMADVAKVVDFGLVKDLSGSTQLSHGDVINGTPLFMAPESLTSPDSVDGRTDLYALGAVGYFLLTGEYVFDGATMVEVCSHHLHSEPIPPSAKASVPGDLEAIILRCLAKKPEARFQDARSLHEALRAVENVWTEAEAEGWWRDHAAAVDQLRRRRLTSVSTPSQLAFVLGARRPAPQPVLRPAEG